MPNDQRLILNTKLLLSLGFGRNEFAVFVKFISFFAAVRFKYIPYALFKTVNVFSLHPYSPFRVVDNRYSIQFIVLVIGRKFHFAALKIFFDRPVLLSVLPIQF